MAGLSPNIRLLPPELATPAMPEPDIIVEMDEDGEPSPNLDDQGNILRIEYPDGSIAVSLDGRPIEEAPGRERGGWFDNLVDDIDPGEMSAIAEDLLRGIRDDITSRQEWIDDRATGIKLLGLKIEIPGTGGSADSAPVEGMSKVRHPLLLEAVLRFQANARSELLPTDGPVKIRNDSNGSTVEVDRMADALEKDMNHYLTATATEYYPDTDRMLLMLGFGGTAFKKVYFCPLRNRPVSETVDADDLIVNNAATDLRNAKRVTHRVFMRPSTVRRLQILDVYRDIDLDTPRQAQQDAAQQEKDSQQGISRSTMNPDDRDREIYECYCELDIRGFEHRFKGKITGLEIPYIVTIDVSSREVLSIVRNYDEETRELPEARTNFVKYTFVPGLGFYDIGLLNILGNTTNAITAAWREMLDAGMFANFPGFLMAKMGTRQNTNIFRVPPGGGVQIDTGGMPINQAIMPLPYKEPGPAMMQMVQNMADTGARIGGTSEAQVGEGRADAPVGTTLALIDQATKIMNSVHKRMCSAQAQEFELLKRTFREHPDSFWTRCKKPSMQWNEQNFMKALDDCELVPQADPNTTSHAQRLMKIMGLKQLQASNPSMYDPIAIDTAALQAMGWSNPEQFMVPAAAQGKPPPEMQEKIAKIQIEKQKADADTMRAQADMQESQARVADIMRGDQEAPTPPDPVKGAELQIKQQEIEQRAQDTMLDAINRQRDRESRERVAVVALAKDAMDNPGGLSGVRGLLPEEMMRRLESNEPGLPIPGGE